MIWFMTQPKNLERMKQRWKLRKEKRKAMRDSYYARERKEAAYQAYLEEIKEIKDEEAKKKSEEVKNLTKTEETAEETKAENPAEESKDDEANILDSEEKKIILKTTFENPTPTEIQ